MTKYPDLLEILSDTETQHRYSVDSQNTYNYMELMWKAAQNGCKPPVIANMVNVNEMELVELMATLDDENNPLLKELIERIKRGWAIFYSNIDDKTKYNELMQHLSGSGNKKLIIKLVRDEIQDTEVEDEINRFMGQE